MPADLEWPRRAIVGAIVVIGVTRPATFAEGPGVLYCGERKDREGRPLQFNAPTKLSGRLKSQTIALSSILTVKHRTITCPFDLRSCGNTNALAGKQARREVRSGESATLACDELTVPSTGRVQQHEQMEAARRSRILGSSRRSRIVFSLPAMQLASGHATPLARMR